MKNIFNSLVIILFLIILFSNKTEAQYEVNKHYLGPEIGFVFNGSTLQFGANYEYALNIQDIGNIGIGGIFRYWSFGDADWHYTDIVIGGQGNYHFRLKNKKLDIWSGLVLGYDFGSWSYDGPDSGFLEPTYGGFILTVNGGARYWFSPTIAVTARLGFGSLSYGALEFGVDFKL